MNSVVLAHPRFCKDLARLIVEILVFNAAVDVMHEPMIDVWRNPQTFRTWHLWFHTNEEAGDFCRDMRCIYGPLLQDLYFDIRTGGPMTTCRITCHT